MAGQWMRRGAAFFAMALLLAIATTIQVRAQSGDNLRALREQVDQLQNQGKYTEAIPIAERFVAVARQRHGEESGQFATAIATLGFLYKLQGRYAEAEPLYKRDLAISEKALGPDHPDVGTSLNNLAPLYRAQGRYAEAEPLFQRDLAILEKALGPGHPDVGTALNNLAGLYRAQNRYAEAEPLYKRSLALREKALGTDHLDVGSSLNNLAVLYDVQGRYAEAEPLYKRGLALREKALGPDHPDVGGSLNNLAELYRGQGRYADAEPLYKRSLALLEKALGADHADVGRSLNNLATLYRVQGRYAEADPLYKRALAISEKVLGPDHPDVGTFLNNLGDLYFVQEDLARSADYWRRSTSVIIRRAQRGLAAGGSGNSEGSKLSQRFFGLVKVTHRLASEGGRSDASLGQDMFQTAQWAFASEAAASLAQMAVRGAKGDPNLSRVVRERQDLVVEWEKRDAARTAAVAQAPDKRDLAAEAANVARLNAIDARIAEIDKQLKTEFPDYAAFSRPEPLTVQQVQVDLRPDEALVLFLDTSERNPASEETFVWVVTKSDMRWVKSPLGTPALTREVAALRCGLDTAAWDGAGRCAELLGIAPDKAPGDNDPLPFDLSRAHALYKALFGEVEELIKGKHLLLVPSGPLTQLPFQVLVTAPPAIGDYRSAAWLARSHALTVLPAVSSLKALRRVAKPSAASKPIIGFGNPLLEGNQMSMKWGNYYKQLAKLARDKQGCDQPQTQQVASLRAARKGTALSAMRGGHVDPEDLKMQTPLPETADELCAVGRALGADTKDLLIGARASESAVKALSASGALAQYRVVHFATHGALAGQLLGTSEPGLILTPPTSATDDDDGYLSASEVAALKLDANWVILSACNTAAGGADGAEAMSGLARAFFYAQARALLVSHWAVDSNATVKLVTNAVTETNDPKVGRGEALRRAMLALIDKGTEQEAHPSFWAPFVVVGEGAAN